MDQFVYLDAMASGHNAEKGEEHQPVADVVEKDSVIGRSLVAVIDSSFEKDSVLHNTVIFVLPDNTTDRSSPITKIDENCRLCKPWAYDVDM